MHLLKCLGSQEGSRIATVNDFLSETGIDNINIFRLSEFVRETKLFFKVSGYAESVSASRAKAAGGGEVRAAGAEAEKLGSLNSVMDLLLALTNNEEDGRVIVDAGRELS